MLQVLDLANLHPGIDQYYRDHHRTKPLNLVHYTGAVSHRAVIEPLQCFTVPQISPLNCNRCL